MLDNIGMQIKDSEIYPSYSFRLSQEDKDWLNQELDFLKIKFNEDDKGQFPVITKNVLILAALRRGLGFLKQREKIEPMVIEKEINIQASPEKVWEALTKSDFLAEWWQKGMKLEPIINGIFFEPWTDAEGKEQLATGSVEAIEPGKFIKFTWLEKAWSTDQVTTCSFELTRSLSLTHLKLVHKGWDRFPLERGFILKSGFESGWEDLLKKLEKFVSNKS